MYLIIAVEIVLIQLSLLILNNWSLILFFHYIVFNSTLVIKLPDILLLLLMVYSRTSILLLILSKHADVKAALIVISSADGNAHGQLETTHRVVFQIGFLNRLDL